MFSAVVITIKTVGILWIAIEIFSKLVNKEDAAWFKGAPRTMMILFYVVAVWCRIPWILYAVIIAYLPLAARTRGEGAALAVIAFGSLPDLPQFLTAGGALLFQVDKWFCVSIGLLIVFLRAPFSGLRYKGHLDLPFALLLINEMIQARDLNFTSTMRVLLLNMLTVGLPYFLITRSIARVEDLRRVVMSLAFLGFVLACVGVAEAITHFLPYQELYNYLRIGTNFGVYKYRGGLLRSVTTFGDTTAFSLNLALMLMAVIACRFSFKSTSKMAIAIIVMLAAIFISSSRNSWIALILSLIAFDLFRGKIASTIGKVSVLGMGYALLLLLAQFSRYFATMMGRSGDTASTSNYRQQLFTRGMEEFWKHPYAGLNTADVYAHLADMKQGEGIVDFVNGYLYFALVGGGGAVIGMVIAFLLPGAMMLRSRRRLLAPQVGLERYAAFAAAVSASYFVTTAFTAFGGRASAFLYVVMGIASVLYAWRRLPADQVAATARQTTVRRSLKSMYDLGGSVRALGAT